MENLANHSLTPQGLDPNLSASSPISLPSIATPSTSGMGLSTYPLQHMGTGGNALAAAASQAIAATQQLVPGRRTSSLKASYEAIHLGVQSHEFQVRSDTACTGILMVATRLEICTANLFR